MKTKTKTTIVRIAKAVAVVSIAKAGINRWFRAEDRQLATPEPLGI